MYHNSPSLCTTYEVSSAYVSLLVTQLLFTYMNIDKGTLGTSLVFQTSRYSYARGLNLGLHLKDAINAPKLPLCRLLGIQFLYQHVGF